MKRIYMTLALLAVAATTALAQPKNVDLGVRPLYGPYTDPIEPGDTVMLMWEISNNGPDPLEVTDTLEIIMDTEIMGEDIADIQYFLPLGCPPLALSAGQKDTLYFRIIEGTEFWSGEAALVDFASNAKQCTWTAIWGFQADSLYFLNDPGVDIPAFAAAGSYDDRIAALSGNNKGFQDVVFGTGATIISECEPSGLGDVNYEKQSLNIYPNPAGNEVNFEFEFAANSSATIRIADISGRTVLIKDFGKQTGATKLAVDISSLNNGIYLVELTTEGRKAISKLTVRK